MKSHKKKVRELLLKPSVSLLFLTVKAPFVVGIYSDGDELIDSIEFDGKTSDVLPIILHDLLSKYEPKMLVYANGPGNQMAIKITYVCLMTISISKNIPLKSASSFVFNSFAPIELVNKRFFCFNGGNVSLEYLPESTDSSLMLPKHIRDIDLSDICEPIYITPPA